MVKWRAAIVMTREDWNNPSMVFGHFSILKEWKTAGLRKSAFFSKLKKKLIFWVDPLKLYWGLVYIRRNRWQIAFPSLKKTHFKVRPTSLFFCKWRKSAQCAICVRLPRCRLSDRFWAGEKKAIEWSALSSQRVFLRACFNSAACVSSQTHQFSVCCCSKKSSS